jgi:hypothetical protein
MATRTRRSCLAGAAASPYIHASSPRLREARPPESLPASSSSPLPAPTAAAAHGGQNAREEGEVRRLLRRLATPAGLRLWRRTVFGGAWVVTAVVGNSGEASVVGAALFLAAAVLVPQPRGEGKQRPPWPTPASAATAGRPRRRARSGLERGTGTAVR